jgi:NADPH:quinone reductase-like Zn-dependent oxidoreductase
MARKPANLTFEQAAGLPLAGLTAYQALVKAIRLGEGETVLVHAAAGGVGSLAVQIAVHLGARVIGTASERNHGYLRSLGAEPVTYGEGLADRVRALAPDGVDAVLDLVGGDALTVSPDLLTTGGRLVSIADGAVLGLGGRYFWVRPDAADLAAVSELAERGVVQVEVAATFPLEKAADAQRLNAEGHTRGKVIVTVD